MANQSIIAVPTQFKDLNEVKIFLSRLIQKIDELAGYRGSNSPTSNPQQAPIADFDYTAPIISGIYTQAEVQAIANSLEAAAEKINTILAELKLSGITG
jgi:hypothetical protein